LMDRFGGEPAARSVEELRAYFRAIRAELRATREARATIRFLLLPPLPLHARPAYAVLAAAATGMLPASVRRELWIPLPPAVEPLMVRPASWAMFRALNWVMAGYPVEASSPPGAS